MRETNCCRAKVEQTTWQGEPAIRFAAGGYEALMIPGVGANVIELKQVEKGLELLRAPEGVAPEAFKVRPQVYGIPVLFPPNRIEDGTFMADGRNYQFTINEIPNNNHIHGFLHRRPWKVTKMDILSEDRVEVEAVFEADASSEFYKEFPHEFEFKLLYTLSEKGLEQKVTIINRSSLPMPMGLGFHTAFKIPFHPEGREEDYRMLASIGDKWELNDRMLPTGRLIEPTELEKGYRQEGVQPVGQVIDKQHFTAQPLRINDREFHGAIIEDRAKAIKLVYECGKGYGHWMLWNSDGQQGFVCPEPQTWAVNAPNIKLPDHVTGFQLLAPGEAWEECCAIYVVV